MHEDTQRTIGTTSVAVGSPWPFFAVTFAVTWGFWLAAAALGLRFDSVVGFVVLVAGLAGPGAAGVGFVYLVYDDRGRTDFWNRVVQVRRIGLRWGLVVLLLPLVVTAAAALVDTLFGGPGAVWAEGAREFAGDPLAILPALFFASLPPVLEELGWRGYALDRLQMRRSALAASLLLGAVWAVWHLPLFFVGGTFQREVVGFATPGFWLFMAGTVALSVAITWMYNHTARSVLGAVLLHGWVNFTAETVEVADAFYYSQWVLLAVLLVAVWGPETLAAADEVPRPPTTGDRGS